MPDSVPIFIKKLSDATGLKQAALAKEIGVSQGTISKWLAGTQSPNKKQWDKVIEFMHKTAKARPLLARMPDFSLDAILQPYEVSVKISAFSIVESFLKTVPQPRRK